jgi:hypothetical protein
MTTNLSTDIFQKFNNHSKIKFKNDAKFKKKTKKNKEKYKYTNGKEKKGQNNFSSTMTTIKQLQLFVRLSL